MKKDKKTIANITMNLAQKLKQIDASLLDHSYAYTVAYKGGVDSPPNWNYRFKKKKKNNFLEETVDFISRVDFSYPPPKKS